MPCVSCKKQIAFSISFKLIPAFGFPSNFVFKRIFFAKSASVTRALFFNCSNAFAISV